MQSAVNKGRNGAISKGKTSQRGQGLVEYVLVVAVIIGAVIIVAKPFFKTFQEKVGENLKNGSVFSENPNFYYFPVRRSGG